MQEGEQILQQAVCKQIVRTVVSELQWQLTCFAARRVTKTRWFRLSTKEANGNHIVVVDLCHVTFSPSINMKFNF